MPALGTVMRWLAKYPEFRAQYASAREAQAEVQQEEIIEISDDCTDDVQILMGNEDQTELGRINHSAIARARLRIDTRKWIMSKMAPKKYGDKTILANDSENPLPSTNLTVAITSEVIKTELQKVRDEF